MGVPCSHTRIHTRTHVFTYLGTVIPSRHHTSSVPPPAACWPLPPFFKACPKFKVQLPSYLPSNSFPSNSSYLPGNSFPSYPDQRSTLQVVIPMCALWWATPGLFSCCWVVTTSVTWPKLQPVHLTVCSLPHVEVSTVSHSAITPSSLQPLSCLFSGILGLPSSPLCYQGPKLCHCSKVTVPTAQ